MQQQGLLIINIQILTKAIIRNRVPLAQHSHGGFVGAGYAKYNNLPIHLPIIRAMEKIQLVHNCLAFEHKKRKYLYGLTYSQLISNFLSKFKPHFIIVPSNSFVNGVFLHAAIPHILSMLASNKATEQSSFLGKVFKHGKLIIGDEKKMNGFYPSDVVSGLLQNSIVSLLKEHELDEKTIMKQHLELIIGQEHSVAQKGEDSSAQLLEWLNCPQYQIKVVVPESGMTTYLCQGTDILVIDPTEQFANYLKYKPILKEAGGAHGVKDSNGQDDFRVEIPTLIEFLKTIIITKMSSITAVLALMLVEGVGKVSVIVVSHELEQALIEKSRKYLKCPEEVTRSRLLIRNIGLSDQPKPYRYPMMPKLNNPFNLQSPCTLTCSYHPLSEQSQPYLEFTFGSSIDIKTNRRIILYCPASIFSTEVEPEAELTHFPYLLKEDSVDLVILYQVNEELMKELKGLPQALRKKIILNRNEHKYNHKYFITFEKNKIEHCLVTDTQYIQLMTFKKVMKNPVQSIENVLHSLKNKEVVIKNISKNKNGSIITMKNIEPGAKVYQMGHQAEIQTIGQVIYVLDGIVKLWFQGSERTAILGGSHSKSQVFRFVEKIQALKFAQVKIIPQSDYEILTNFKNLEPGSQNISLIESPDKKVNMISSLNEVQHIGTILENSLIRCLSLSQQKELNKICHPVTYQVGFKTNNYNENVYFISKGGMKWEDNDEIAANGYFIGDLSAYYSMKEGSLHQFDNYIEVVKDTWALEINIEEFHQFFILSYPHLLSLIQSKGKIFR